MSVAQFSDRDKQAHTTALERGDVRKRSHREQYSAGVEAVAVVAAVCAAYIRKSRCDWPRAGWRKTKKWE